MGHHQAGSCAWVLPGPCLSVQRKDRGEERGSILGLLRGWPHPGLSVLWLTSDTSLPSPCPVMPPRRPSIPSLRLCPVVGHSSYSRFLCYFA